MRSWLRIGIMGAGALAVMLGPLGSAPASAQVERIKVMVANLVPLDRADDDFGKDLSKALREFINDLASHQAIEEKEIRNEAKKYDLDMEDLDCVRSLQLSPQFGANLVFCGAYTEDKQAKTFTLTGVKFASTSSAPLEVPDKTYHEDDHEIAAQEIAALFGQYTEQIRKAVICGDYYDTGEWESAERNCLEVLSVAPNDTQVRYILANVYKESDRLDEAYAETLKVIELDPLNENALQLAGWLATTLGMKAEGRAHNDAYLRLNPGNAQIRMTIAYEVAQAGDPEGAMILVEEGLEIEPDNTDLLLQHASFAIAAGQALKVDNQPLSPEAGQFYQRGSESYRQAYAVLGANMSGDHLYQMIGALNDLGLLDRAVELAEQVLETHSEEASLWYIQGIILNKLGRVDEALQALDEAEGRDPKFPNLKATQGQWLLAVGREDDALPVLIEAVEKGEQPADIVASMFFGRAGAALQAKDWENALRLIDMAKTFEHELSSRLLGQLDYYKAFSIYQIAYAQQGPQNLQTAQLTLPRFKEVQQMLTLPHVVDWVEGAQAQQKQNYQQVKDGVVQLISIQELIIRRGR